MQSYAVSAYVLSRDNFRMESKELRNFARIARCGSFSRAAVELGVAQPALSRQVSKLERELGVALFARHGRGVHLTSAGSLLLDRAEAVEHLIHRISDEVKEDGDLRGGGSVVLGVPPAAGQMIIPPLVGRLRIDSPLLTLHIREGVSTLLQEWLVDQRIDIAVLHNPPALESLEIIPVLSERMVVIGPPKARRDKAAEPKTENKTGNRTGDKRGDKTSYRIGDLAELPLIMPSLPHNIRRLVEQAAADHGVRLRVQAEVDSVAFTKLMVQNGLGFSILTHAAVQAEMARGELQGYPIERPTLSSTVTVVTRRETIAAQLTERVKSTLRLVIRDLVQQKQWASAKLLA
jgi:LysR family nitrogen assimilation transcriptional regulator